MVLKAPECPVFTPTLDEVRMWPENLLLVADRQQCVCCCTQLQLPLLIAYATAVPQVRGLSFEAYVERMEKDRRFGEASWCGAAGPTSAADAADAGAAARRCCSAGAALIQGSNPDLIPASP